MEFVQFSDSSTALYLLASCVVLDIPLISVLSCSDNISLQMDIQERERD
jgi:hypothetical protein